MKWTDKLPDREGWWWLGANGRRGFKASPVYVRSDGSSLVWVNDHHCCCEPLVAGKFEWSDVPIAEPDEGEHEREST